MEYKYLSIAIQHVFRGNFNDTYYLENQYVDLDEFKKEEPKWIDPFNGRSKIGNTLISLKNITTKNCLILEKKNNIIKEETVEYGRLYIICEDFDSSTMLAAHITFTNEIKEY